MCPEPKAKPHLDHLNALLLLVADEWSEWARREADDNHYPIARDAAEAIAELPKLPDAILGELIDRAKATEDVYLMVLLLGCVVKHGSQERQAQVIEMSRRGRRLAVGRAAAHALFEQHGYLSEETVASISTQMISRLPASIAGYLVAVLGLRAPAAALDAAVEVLATSDDRRIFLALLARMVADRDPERAASIAAKLPDGQPARLWAEGSDAPVDRSALIDLGDASAVKEAYNWMPKPEKVEG
jgi:hypothetical protein